MLSQATSDGSLAGKCCPLHLGLLPAEESAVSRTLGSAELWTRGKGQRSDCCMNGVELLRDFSILNIPVTLFELCYGIFPTHFSFLTFVQLPSFNSPSWLSLY